MQLTLSNYNRIAAKFYCATPALMPATGVLRHFDYKGVMKHRFTPPTLAWHNAANAAVIGTMFAQVGFVPVSLLVEPNYHNRRDCFTARFLFVLQEDVDLDRPLEDHQSSFARLLSGITWDIELLDAAPKAKLRFRDVSLNT